MKFDPYFYDVVHSFTSLGGAHSSEKMTFHISQTPIKYVPNSRCLSTMHYFLVYSLQFMLPIMLQTRLRMSNYLENERNPSPSCFIHIPYFITQLGDMLLKQSVKCVWKNSNNRSFHCSILICKDGLGRVIPCTLKKSKTLTQRFNVLLRNIGGNKYNSYLMMINSTK